MTESCNTCSVCDPITKYDIRENNASLINQETGSSINIDDISDLVNEDVRRFTDFGNIGDADNGVDPNDFFAILNPTPEKLQARETARKSDDFNTDIKTGNNITGPETSALVEKGFFVADTSSSFIINDPNYSLFDTLLKTLCCVEVHSLVDFNPSIITGLREKINSAASYANVNVERSELAIRKILSSPFRVRQIVNVITNARVPETPIISSVSVSCLSRNRVPRIIPIDNGNNAQEVNENYLASFISQTDFRLLVGIIRGLECSNLPVETKFSNITNALDFTQNKFNNPQRGLNDSSANIQGIITALINLITVITDFGQGSKSDHLSQIARLPNVISALQNFTNALNAGSKGIDSLQIPNLREALNIAKDVQNKTRVIRSLSEDIRPINTMAESNPLFNDITNILVSIQGKTNSLLPEMNRILTLLGGNNSFVSGDEYIQNRDPGSMLGNFLSGIVLGQAIPTQKQSNNPTLQSPSYLGKAFFGESAISLPGVDQSFSRRVGMFQDASGAAGATSFAMQNDSRSRNVSQAISSILTGFPTSNSPIVNQSVNQIATDVSQLLGTSINTSVELNRPDNAIPIMIGLAARISDDKYSPFSSSVYTEGWKVASYVRAKLQTTNPGIFE